MEETGASSEVETVPEVSQKDPPKVVIQQPSESDVKSEENGDDKNVQNDNTVNNESENTVHEDASHVKDAESQDKVDSNQTSTELESVGDVKAKSSDNEIVDTDNKDALSDKNSPEENDVPNNPSIVGVQSESENVQNSSNPTNEMTEITTGDSTIELLRSKTPEIIITPSDDDVPGPNRPTLQEKEVAETTDITPPTQEVTNATPSEDKASESSQGSDTPPEQVPPHSQTNLDSEASLIETPEDQNNAGKPAGGSRPTSADQTKSKTPEPDSPENDTEKVLEISKDGGSDSESKLIDDSSSEKPAGILELVTKRSIYEETHPPPSDVVLETAYDQDTFEKPTSPVSDTMESESDALPNKTSSPATPPADEVTSVTSDEHAGAEDPHKDGYDASVSGNEEESNDPSAYIPTALENSMLGGSHQTELSAAADTATVHSDVAATSSETLVASNPPTPESRRRPAKSVTFSEENNIHNNNDDDGKKSEDLRRLMDTPTPGVVKVVDLEEAGLEKEQQPEESQASRQESGFGSGEQDNGIPIIPTPSPDNTIMTPEPSSPPPPPSPPIIEDLKVENGELKTKIRDLENKITCLEEEKSRVIEENNVKSARVREADKKAQEYEKQIKQIQSDIDELNKKLQDKDKDIASKIRKIETQNNDISKLNTEVGKLRSSSKVCVIL